MFCIAWSSVHFDTHRDFLLCVSAVFIFDIFTVLLDSLFSSDWMFVIALPRNLRDYAPLVDVCGSRREILLALPRNRGSTALGGVFKTFSDFRSDGLI